MIKEHCRPLEYEGRLVKSKVEVRIIILLLYNWDNA